MVSTYIKLDRSITNWRWFQDANTLTVWIYILCRANVVQHDFADAVIKRGEFATSYPSLALATGLTENKVRTAIEHLKKTGEITVRSHSKFSVISVVNYDLYQGTSQTDHRQITDKSQSDHSQVTVKSQQYNNERMKESKNERMRDYYPHAKTNNNYETKKAPSYGIDEAMRYARLLDPTQTKKRAAEATP